MSTELYNDTITIANGKINFIPSGSATINPIIAESFSTASFEVTCSANTDGHLAPTDTTGSFLMFIHPHGARLSVLYTTASNPSVSSSLFTPALLQKLRGKHVTASINLGDSANQVALATFTALSKSLSDQHTRTGASSFTVSTTGSAVTVTPTTPGRSVSPIFNAQLTSSYGFIVKAPSTGSGILNEDSDHPGSIDNSQASIIFQLTGNKTRDLTISSSKGDLLFVSESGRVGVGTKEPNSFLDVKGSIGSDPADIILRTATTADTKILSGNETGRISFLIESSSFRVGKTKTQFIRSGSSAEIFSRIIGEDAGAAYGSLIFSVNDEDNTTAPIEALTIGHNTLESVSGVTLIVSGAMKMAHNNPRFIFEDTATGHQAAYIGARSIPNADDGVLELYTGGNKTVQIDGTNGRISGSGEVIGATGSFGLIEGGTF